MYRELDNPDSQIFDRFIFLSMIILEKAFYGELTEYQNRAVFPKIDDPSLDESGVSFEKSIFYKELRNDISKYLYISINIYI